MSDSEVDSNSDEFIINTGQKPLKRSYHKKLKQNARKNTTIKLGPSKRSQAKKGASSIGKKNTRKRLSREQMGILESIY